MKAATTALLLSVITATAAIAQPVAHPREIRVSSVDALCTGLLDARRSAESQGRLDFAVEVEPPATDDSVERVARVWMGSAHAVRRIDFVGHSKLNDTTLRRALVVNERDVLDIVKLRRSLARINSLGVYEPLRLTDVNIARLDDGVTVDLTIPLRERKPRWWSLAAPVVPAMRLQASLASRLPPWGRGVFETATYVASLNVAGVAKPFLALQRPIIPGQEWRSGFAITSSPSAMLVSYASTHLAHSIAGMLDGGVEEPLVAPVTSASRQHEVPLVCTPDRGRLWWLRRIAATAIGIAMP
jgi:hypothetical protein